MSLELILTIQNATVSFGKKYLFEDLSLNIHAGNKICLIGKNGSGKTTLMNIIAGDETHMETGKRWQALGLKVGYLSQEIKFDPKQNVEDFILSEVKKDTAQEEKSHLAQMMAQFLDLNLTDKMANLSGGQLRRTGLAKALIEHPDLLLLDEPTNHLDFEAVKWLEDYLKSYQGSLILISHDRAFLKNISNKVFWLDRGKIRVCPKGYSYFEEWSEMLLEQERRELENREAIIEQEEEWASRGIKARRKRNQQRLLRVKEERERLRKDQSLYRQTMQKMELEPLKPSMFSQLVAEFIKVSKKFTHQPLVDANSRRTTAAPPCGDPLNQSDKSEKIILDNFNFRMMQGDKIGMLGKNGSGKTTVLKMLLQQIQPDLGKVKLAKNIEFSYFDQKRVDLDNNETLWKTLAPNGDYVNVMGKPRHVCGYLKDFLFDPKSAKDMVGTLSGGQKNRLMLARALANPGNCLILDEPTNDLDMESLDILAEILSKYQGTLLLVTHDRDFLDQVVNKILVFKGQGDVNAYIGGYSDYLEETAQITESKKEVSKKTENKNNKPLKKLTYKLQFEFDNIPTQVEKLNKELLAINQKFLDPDFANLQNDERDKILKRSSEIQHEIERLEDRWLEIANMIE